MTELFPLDLESDILRPFLNENQRLKINYLASRPPQNGPGVTVYD